MLPRGVEQPHRRTVAAHQTSHRTSPQPSRPPPRPALRVRVSHGKAAEYQARGAVHFHVLLRLDGQDPHDPDRLLPPPLGITVADLQEATRHAAATISYLTPPHPAMPAGWRIALGERTGRPDHHDARHRHGHRSHGRQLSGQVLHQGTEVTGHASTRLTPATVELHADATGTHAERLVHACWKLGRHPDYTQPPAVGAHARLRRPLPDQSPPLLRHLRRPARRPHHLPPHPGPRPRTRAHPHRRPRRTRKPPSSSATSPTPEPAGKPAATPSWPAPPPTKPENDAKPDTTKSPMNTTAPPAARPHNPFVVH